jgi:murein DD-endopeptidase MepM/ murein hydrolase activator NlpD
MDPRDDNGDGIADRYHRGVDSQGPLNTSIYSVLAGTVTSSVSNGLGGYGNTVVVQHANGWSTRYAHFSTAPLVTSGQVSAGQQIGRMGRTGTGIVAVHLHFEVYRDGINVDLLAFLAGTLRTVTRPPTPTPTNEESEMQTIVAVPGGTVVHLTPGAKVSFQDATQYNVFRDQVAFIRNRGGTNMMPLPPLDQVTGVSWETFTFLCNINGVNAS